MDMLLSVLQADFLGKAVWIWLVFLAVVVTLLGVGGGVSAAGAALAFLV